uniref:Ig-like domain-containing protein n=1 Tax=Tetraodon nigroviridis TaxID=99883 RepID=H3BXS5_TETNG
MIMIIVLFLFLHLLGDAGASKTQSVFQEPPFIIMRAGESLVSGIKCSHTISGYDLIYWYKQDESRTFKFLGYLNVLFATPEDDVKGKINFDGDGRSHSSLNISGLFLNDSGVYFCAASSHSFQCDTGSEAYFGPGTKLTVL